MGGFEELSDFDFERFVADLLSAHWGVRVESFPRGQDGGVDLRALGPTGPPLSLDEGEELVVQCKHYPRGTFSVVKPALGKEAKRPILQQASRYVLATSARLTRANKQKIAELFTQRVHERDILAINDLEDLLRRHPEVEASNLKLWLTRAGTLQALVNQMEHLRTATFLENLRRLRRTFVETPALAAADEVVRRYGLCLLTGPPGAGKTTTASLLLLRYMAQGWQPVVAVGEVGELERQWRPTEKQILFYDDFLGQNILSAKLHKNEDSALIRLMRQVERDENKILILATRRYILRQAQHDYEKLNDPLFELSETAVSVESLDARQREHILYNQLYFSPLREAVTNEAKSSGRQRLAELVHSSNYNPRLTDEAIASIVRQHFARQHRSGEGPVEGDGGSIVAKIDVFGQLERVLRKPGQLWKHVLQSQLSQAQLDVLVALVSFGNVPVLFPRLLIAVGTPEGMGAHELSSALHVLDGDLVTLGSDEAATPERQVVSLRGPGVTDGLIAYLRQRPDVVARVAMNAMSFEQVEWLAAFAGRRRDGWRDGISLDSALIGLLCHAVQRVFMTERLPHGLFEGPALVWHRDLGERMRLLGDLSAANKSNGDMAFVDRVAATVISHIDRIPVTSLLEAIVVMDQPWMTSWRPHRTVISDLLLRELSDPEDLDGWTKLTDAIDVITVTDEFQTEAERQFEHFAADMINTGQDMLDDDPEEFAKDFIADELRDLHDLAGRWNFMSSELDDLIDFLDENGG